MYSKKEFKSQTELYSYLKSNSNVYFFGEFLRELDSETDELIFIIRTNRFIDFNNVPLIINIKSKRKILTTKVKSGEKLMNFGELIYGAYGYQNEIYDFYGKETIGFKNHISRLHFFPKNYFPYRIIGKPDIEIKNEFIFPNIEGDGLVCVPVGPIHAGIIPPGHFRFLVDGEDTYDLEIQLGWKTRLVDKYFIKETELDKLLLASGEIVGDSVVAYTLGFIKNIENSASIKISDLSKSTRIVMLEIERIYNHLWTIGALGNDVGQAYILNGFLAIREQILNMNEYIFGDRLLKGNIEIGDNRVELDFEKIKEIRNTLNRLLPRIKNLVNIIKFSSGMYDRFKDTGIISKEVALKHSALGIPAKASMISIDSRTTDDYYISLGLSDINIPIGETGDCFDRLIVRSEEIFQSIDIIDRIYLKFKDKYFAKRKIEKGKISVNNLKLNDGYFISNIEGHRGENLQIMIVENNKITYYKHKDPSFVNWALLEYSVLKNIIADFPICNKSLDLSYSGFDM